MKYSCFHLLIAFVIVYLGSTAEAKIKVAVIDTGVDTQHSAIKAYLRKESFGWNFAKNNGVVTDHHGHGTHITGLIISNSTLSPDQLEIITIKYYEEGADGAANLVSTLRGLEYAIAQGVDIINFSGGGPGKNQLEEKLINKAKEAGIVVVCASGNEGQNLKNEGFYPASYQTENIIAVTAIDDSTGTLLRTSNYGKGVHLAAPGYQLKSTLPNNKQGQMTGTSQATAVVTGIIARLFYEKPYLQGDFKRLKLHLLNTTKADLNLIGKTESTGSLDPVSSLRERDDLVLFNEEKIEPKKLERFKLDVKTALTSEN